MDSKFQVSQLFATYRALFPLEDQSMLQHFLMHYHGDELFNRKNFKGHITASALVLNKTKTKLLLLHHKHLHIDLPPGGHVDAGDLSVLDAAYRETQEEAGIMRNELHLLPITNNTRIPLDINSHLIPANDSKNEPPHVHHDFRYLFIFLPDRTVKADPGESAGVKWLVMQELSQNPDYDNIMRKINRLI